MPNWFWWILFWVDWNVFGANSIKKFVWKVAKFNSIFCWYLEFDFFLLVFWTNAGSVLFVCFISYVKKRWKYRLSNQTHEFELNSRFSVFGQAYVWYYAKTTLFWLLEFNKNSRIIFRHNWIIQESIGSIQIHAYFAWGINNQLCFRPHNHFVRRIKKVHQQIILSKSHQCQWFSNGFSHTQRERVNFKRNDYKFRRIVCDKMINWLETCWNHVDSLIDKLIVRLWKKKKFITIFGGL